jgi:hypothetical protein
LIHRDHGRDPRQRTHQDGHRAFSVV